MKILVAEDDPVTREMVKRMLSRIADVVLEASDGLQALEIIEREDPDFLFTDVDMPLMSGYDLIRSLRASQRWARMPVVCLSSIRDREEVTRLLDLGVVDYLLKPIRAQSAQERCRSIIAQHMGWRSQPPARNKRVLLLVEPDPNFRAFAKALLQLDFFLIESASGADAARKYQAAEIKPEVALIAAKLPLLSGSQLRNMLVRFANDVGVKQPMTILMSDVDVPEEEAAPFNGVMRRTSIPGEFQLEIRRLLGSQETPFEKLTAHVCREEASWFNSGVSQTLGVMTGSDAACRESTPPAPWTSGVSASIQLSSESVGGKLHVEISADRASAKRMAAAVLRRDERTDAQPGEAFVELINAIGGRVRASLEQHGWDLNLGAPKVDENHSLGGEPWSRAAWFETTAGDVFHVGLRLGPPEGVTQPGVGVEANASEPTSEAKPVVAAEADGVLF